MALAFLQFRGQNSGNYLFQADVGTAKYFKYVLGEKKHKLRVLKDEYIEVLSGDKKVSNLFQINEAMHKINRGSFPLKIPNNEINNTTKYVQLYSFNRRDTKAPTISNIIRLYPNISRNNAVNTEFELSVSQAIETKKEVVMQDFEVKNKEFNYREPPLSKVMFWNAIISALPMLVKHAAPVIGGLLEGIGKAGSSASANATAGTNNQSDEVIAKVVEVLQAIAKTNSNAATPQTTASNTIQNGQSNANATTSQHSSTTQMLSLGRLSSAYNLDPETLMGLKPILEKILSPEAILAIGDEPQKLFLAIKDAVQKTEGHIAPNEQYKATKKSKAQTVHTKYSEAKIAPALLAALPALMPIIEKIVDPKIIEAIGNQPVKLISAISDSVLKMDAQEIQHLENINPGVDSAADISKLLQGMSISSSLYRDDMIQFKMIKNLNLDFINTKTVNFKNKDRILYSKNNRIVIPFKISSNSGDPIYKTLKKSIIQILIKDAKSMDLVFRKNINLLDVNIGQVVNDAFLTQDEVKQIPCNTELKLELSYIWKSNKNERIGVFKSHYIHFIDTYIFDRIGNRIGESIPFNDINIHRKYWHKIWEGGFSNSHRWHVEFDIKYFYLLHVKTSGLSRLETRKMIMSDNIEEGQEHPKRRKIKAKLKSGTEFGLDVINNTLALLNQETLDKELLKILRKSAIAEEFHQVARQRVEMKGREGDTATLWSYPEMAIYKLHLSKIGNIDDYGQVITIDPIEKVIAKPDVIHFIGTKSER